MMCEHRHIVFVVGYLSHQFGIGTVYSELMVLPMAPDRMLLFLHLAFIWLA